MSQMSKERMEKALEQLKTISKEDYTKVKALAAIVKPLRSVLHKTPDDYGMLGWRDIYFPSDDGTPLEGWYIPATAGESDKLIIFNQSPPWWVWLVAASFLLNFGLVLRNDWFGPTLYRSRQRSRAMSRPKCQ